mmetsp:Transcript_101048/g.274644  ORF Transcript_101048/g.274644 Transcript_101048/m.274644 type:complete len:383 (+) Transcript_101048:277-1425(+)
MPVLHEPLQLLRQVAQALVHAVHDNLHLVQLLLGGGLVSGPEQGGHARRREADAEDVLGLQLASHALEAGGELLPIDESFPVFVETLENVVDVCWQDAYVKLPQLPAERRLALNQVLEVHPRDAGVHLLEPRAVLVHDSVEVVVLVVARLLLLVLADLAHVIGNHARQKPQHGECGYEHVRPKYENHITHAILLGDQRGSLGPVVEREELEQGDETSPDTSPELVVLVVLLFVLEVCAFDLANLLADEDSKPEHDHEYHNPNPDHRAKRHHQPLHQQRQLLERLEQPQHSQDAQNPHRAQYEDVLHHPPFVCGEGADGPVKQTHRHNREVEGVPAKVWVGAAREVAALGHDAYGDLEDEEQEEPRVEPGPAGPLLVVRLPRH